jgi:predicted CXXCH cytochrome family protein
LCVLAALLLAGPALAEKKDTCVDCHQTLNESHAAIVRGMEQDVHAQYGLSCADCHGGDPTDEDMMASMDPGRGYLGVPTVEQIPEFCGTCHADAAYIRRFKPRQRVDQLELYRTSVHGQQHQKGDRKVAQCVSCHGVHGILPGSDPRSPVYPTNVPKTCARCHGDAGLMADYHIPTDQFDKYRTSVHGRALLERGARGAPACHDCHGNHGAAPPGVSSVSNVCGQCHPANWELLAQSPHQKPFEEMGLAGCKTCHRHHDIQRPTDSMLGTKKGSVCISCHKSGSGGYQAAAEMRRAIEGLKAKRDAAEQLIVRAEQAGMEVSQARFDLNEVGSFLTRARTSVHAFSPPRTEEVVKQGEALAEMTARKGEQALVEIQARRRGFAGFLVILLAAGVALFLKIRDVDRREGV